MIMRLKDISRITTEIAQEYIGRGYYFSNTMSGHQGEIYKVDLTNGEEVIRIVVDDGTTRFKNKDKEYDFEKADVVYILVECFTNEKLNRTLWNGKGEEINYFEFYKINRYFCGEDYIVTDCYNEYKEIVKKQNERLKNKPMTNIDMVALDNKKASRLLKIVNSRKGYKSVRKSQIKGMKTYVNRYNKRKYYYIIIDGKQNLDLIIK